MTMLAVALTFATAMAQYSAEEVLDRAAQHFLEAGGVEISFTVTADNQQTQGVIQVQMDKFRLDTGDVTTWFDGHTQWTYVPDNAEVTISEPTAEELQTLNPYAWLSLYKQNYSYKLAETKVPGVYKVVLTTTVSRQDMQSIVLLIDKETFVPTRLSMAGRGGRDVAVIAINSCQDGKNYPDVMFSFRKQDFPLVEVIDLR